MKLISLRNALLAGLSAGLLTLGVAPADAATAPDPQDRKTYSAKPYVISDPDLVKNPEKVVAELKAKGNLDRFGVEPATSDGPSELTGKRARSAAQLADPSFVTDSSRFPRGSKPADIYDYATRAQCMDQNYDLASRDIGWIKNRYSYCQIHLVAIPAVECGIFPPRCRTTGVFVSRNVLIGQGKLGSYETNSESRWAEFQLNVGVISATGPFARSGADLEATIECDGNYLDEDYPQNDGNACFGGLKESTEKSIKEWQSNGDATLDVISQASTPDVSMGEQIGTGVFHIEYDFDLPWYWQFIDTESPEGGMRFDSAYYLPEEKKGSIFDRATPGLSYAKSQPEVAGVAQHLEDARSAPDTTMPTQPGKVLHGGNAEDPIHRLAPSKGTDEQFRYDENRRIVTNYCRTKEMQDLKATLPVDQGPYDCDEYAFASTYEGAGRFLFPNDGGGPAYERHYSVRWVNSEVNQEAGRRLGRWYMNDRILDREKFFVPIVS
ncbi:NucA/NucB deoxyribonuclease domain-containing protein [Streptomyces sp. A5-4]|uniref:NucA/NucB deoxyribonuclease domain-containing protein n=1 Tax=Streptomyces sp. A5-4 TaxID=3384771 RepID=UPI003DA860E8